MFVKVENNEQTRAGWTPDGSPCRGLYGTFWEATHPRKHPKNPKGGLPRKGTSKDTRKIRGKDLKAMRE